MTRVLDLPEITITARDKAFPFDAVGRPAAALSATLDDFLTPVLALRRSALDHNLATMARFCREHGLALAPHVKTTMSPEIAEAQLERGAWALTLASPSQVRAFRSLGARRIVLANELTDPQAIRWLGAELARDSGFTCYCYVDSLDGVELLEKELGQRTRPLPVLVELGVPGGRTGVRDLSALRSLAERVRASEVLELAGIGGFEGIIGGTPAAELLANVRGYLRRLRDAADELAGDGEFVVTVGGSAFPEVVADELGPGWQAGRAIRVVLRSGCYVTHDSLVYEDYRTIVGTEYRTLPLRPSLELWSRVLSCPEPGLAILDFGKRDTGVDAGFPVPLRRIRRDTHEIEPAPPGGLVALNDQHAHFRGGELAVGDRVAFGVSHPCTTFDKWRLVPVFDDRYVLCGTVRTLF
ncbi:alanine racemase [Amycolatopsis sacchari]|uniref:alanine racemase n=1 Tax=Amycolatopsis sacchari TaxID=115433 RepID=UPI003EBBCBB6